MSEFMMLFRGGADLSNSSAEEIQANMQKWIQWMDGLSKDGKMSGAQPLASTVKMVKGTKKVVSDGPFIEGKEMVGGYLICNAKDIDEAVELTKGCPILEHENGVVEVRPIQQM